MTMVDNAKSGCRDKKKDPKQGKKNIKKITQELMITAKLQSLKYM